MNDDRIRAEQLDGICTLYWAFCALLIAAIPIYGIGSLYVKFTEERVYLIPCSTTDTLSVGSTRMAFHDTQLVCELHTVGMESPIRKYETGDCAAITADCMEATSRLHLHITE